MQKEKGNMTKILKYAMILFLPLFLVAMEVGHRREQFLILFNFLSFFTL